MLTVITLFPTFNRHLFRGFNKQSVNADYAGKKVAIQSCLDLDENDFLPPLFMEARSAVR